MFITTAHLLPETLSPNDNLNHYKLHLNVQVYSCYHAAPNGFFVTSYFFPFVRK